MWEMPEWRREDGTLMIWDPTSHSYVEGPSEGGDLAVDRGHASGGDNDLFDSAQGDGNMFQPKNPDNNGWLDGKTSAANSQWFIEAERGDELVVLSDMGDYRQVTVQDRTYMDTEVLIATDDTGLDFVIQPDGDVFWMDIDGPEFLGVVVPDSASQGEWDLRDDVPGDLTIPEHWGKIAMAMRPEQWQEIIASNPYVYHVTEPNRLPSIKAHGLVPGSSVSDKTEGVWTEMGGIPARQGFIYLWATREGAEHGADWFLGIPNPTLLTIDANYLDPKLIEADEDYASDDPERFVQQHGGPTPEEYYGDTNEYDQGNWTGFTPLEIASEAGSNWATENPLLGDPDVTYESYKGFGDRQDYHGRVAYGGSIPPDAIVKIEGGLGPHASKTASGRTMYHFSPAQNRESILQHGLDPSFGMSEPVVWLTLDPNPYWVEAEGDDLWEVNVDGLEIKNPAEVGRTTTEDWWICTEPIGPERLSLKNARMAKTAEVAEIAPAMPDLNYVLDYNPEDVAETGWYARIWSPNYLDGANKDIGGKSDKKYKDIHPTGVWSESFGTWQQCSDYLRQEWKNDKLYAALDVAQPDAPFEWSWDGSGTYGPPDPSLQFMFPVVAAIEPLESKTSKVAGETQFKQLQRKRQLEWDYPDAGEVVHEFPNGWKIKRATTYGDIHRTGECMGNCWSLNNMHTGQLGGSYDMHPDWPWFDSNGQPGPQGQGYPEEWPSKETLDKMLPNLNLPIKGFGITDGIPHHWLENPVGLPKVAFYHTPAVINPKSTFEHRPWGQTEQAFGMHNSYMKPEYREMLQQWHDTLPYPVETDDTWNEVDEAGRPYEMYARVAMPYHMSPRGNRENIEREGLQDTTGAGGLYFWDHPDQAKAYWEWLKDVGGFAGRAPDVWEFEIPEHINPEPDDHLHYDMARSLDYSDEAMQSFMSPPWDPNDPETAGFGAWFAPGLEGIPPDKLKRVAMPYWHTSPRENRDSIESQGLIPGGGRPKPKDDWMRPGRNDHVFLTQEPYDPEEAGSVGMDIYEVSDEDAANLGLVPDPTGDAETYGMSGKWWATPNTIPPDKVRRIGMAERSGDPVLDQLIEEFSRQYDTEKLRDPRNAWSECIYYSEAFAAFLQSRGINAKIIILPRDEEWGRTQTMYEDPNYSEEEWDALGITWNRHPPGATLNDLEYQGGDFEDHHAVQVELNGHKYIVDWTATQYDSKSEVPHIFRLDGNGGWRPDF